MDTPVSKTETLPPPSPSKLFFDGLDIPSGLARNEARVTRGDALQQLRRRKDQVNIALTHLRAADDAGVAMMSAEALVAITDQLQLEVYELAAKVASAHARWAKDHHALEFNDDSATQESPANPAGGAAAGMVVTVKPSDINYPTNMATAIVERNRMLSKRNVHLNPALRMGRS